jgi:histidyl-tRNA synthetase
VPDVYAVVPSPEALPTAVRVAETLRAAGVAVLMHAAAKDGWGSMKSQFRRADASGARQALIFGADELGRGLVAVKPLRDAGAAQTTRSIADVESWADELRNT